MSSLAAATLARLGVAEIVIANRTPDRAERLAQIINENSENSEYGEGSQYEGFDGYAGGATSVSARAVPMESVPFELTRADIAVSCTGATGLVLTAEIIAAAVEGRVPADEAGLSPRTTAKGDIWTALPPTSLGTEDGCPLDLSAGQAGQAVQESAGFSVMGEAAVAGMDAATLEQHAAWVDNGTVGRRDAARRTPDDDRELIAALALTVAALGRIPERRRPEALVGVDRPPAVLSLLDLAMPRDVDAAAHRLAGVRLVDIESLAEASADAPMAADVDQVRRIVADEVAAFGAALRAAHITPTVVALRAMAADVVAGEIARLDGRLPGLDDKHRAEITQTVRRVVDKLLHAPTVRVKQLAAEPGGAGYADALRTLFDLDQETVTSVSRADRADQADRDTDHSEQNAENRGRA